MPEADFAGYVAAAKDRIAAANRAIGRPLAQDVIEDRAPFELEPDAACPRPADGRHDRAALLIHGLGDTPYAMRALGARLAAECYLVRAVLLPGHGTVPGDLLTVDAGDWIEAVRRAIDSFAGVARRLYLVGFGEGGTLAVHAALADPVIEDVELAGLVLLAPTLRLRAGSALLARTHEMIGGLLPADRFVAILPDADPVRYETIAWHARAQVGRLIGEVDERQRLLALPVFMAVSADDVEIDADAARRWFCRRLVGPRRLIWYARSGEQVTDCRLAEVRASDGAPGILDLAHDALPIAPEDPRYGAGSGYLDCAHYYWQTDTPNWLLCADPGKTPDNSAIRYGEVSERNLAAHVVRRLTYNPDFAALAAALVDFLARAPGPNPPVPPPKPADAAVPARS